MTQRFAAYIHPTHCDSFITKFIHNLCDILQQRKWVHKIAMHQPSTESSNGDESDRIQSVCVHGEYCLSGPSRFFIKLKYLHTNR